jgi:glycogen debranching enzyme
MEQSTITVDGKPRPCTILPHQGSVPHAFVMDCTHDNESPRDKRTAEDALPTGALVPLAWAAIGSNKGFDDLYGKLLNVVSETRHYATYETPEESGIGRVKRLLNHLHTEMAIDGYSEGHFSQEGEVGVPCCFSLACFPFHSQLIRVLGAIRSISPPTAFTLKRIWDISSSLTRPFPRARNAAMVMLPVLSLNCLGCTRPLMNTRVRLKIVEPIRLRRTKMTFILGATLHISSRDDPADPNLLQGLPSQLETLQPVEVAYHTDGEGEYAQVTVPERFPPGSVLVYATWNEGLTAELDAFVVEGADKAVSSLDMVDLNVVLYRSHGEERDATGRFS